MHSPREYTLSSPDGMQITLLETGASLVGVRAADRNGTFANVALGLKGPGDTSCAGATIAPYAGRIARGQMEIDAQTFQLSLNEGRNHNHGGFHSLRDRPWRCDGQLSAAQYQQIAFSAELEDGVDGYPGNRRFAAIYRLWHDRRIEILLEAKTDRATRVNLTNHAYFNLSGDFSSDVSRHLLLLNAREVYLNDDEFIMTGRAAPPDALDFSRECEIGNPCGHAQIERARGLNHCYVLHSADQAAATLVCPDSGRRLRLYTDQPCLMLYSGGYLDTPNCAITFEALEHPISPCAKAIPPVLYPGETYRRRIVYQFDTV